MITAGFGFRKAATMASLQDALSQAAGGGRPDVLASLERKAGADCLMALAQSLSLPIVPIPDGQIRGVGTLTQSPRIERAFATGSVAEAVALAAAGPGARLLGARCVSADRMATVALAIGADT